MSDSQINFRATHYIGELSLRDKSPHTAARFATIRYMELMNDYRMDLIVYFTRDELKFLFANVLPRLDFRRPNDIELLWAFTMQVDLSVMHLWPNVKHFELSAKVRNLEPILLDALVDSYKVYIHTPGSKTKAWSLLWKETGGQRRMKRFQKQHMGR